MPILRNRAKKPIFRLILIRPTKYDDDGYVMRYWRGVLPSNTLAALSSLTRQTVAEGAFTAPVLQRVAKARGVAMPIVDTVCALLAGEVAAGDAVAALLARPLTAE